MAHIGYAQAVALVMISPAPLASLALWASQPGGEGGSPGWGLGTMLLVSTLVVALLAALVVALFLLRRRKDSHSD